MSDSDPLHLVPTRDGYERWAGLYDGEDNPLVLLEELHIWPLIGQVQGLHVADIGCGTGRTALRPAAEGARVTALDFSQAMLDRARAKPGAQTVTFIQHDLAQPLPLPDAAFDRVHCCLVLDHIAAPAQLFAELRRISRPHGAIL